MKQETLYITQGSTYLKDMIVYNSQGNRYNLNNHTATMRIAKYFGTDTKYGITVSIVEPQNGLMRISISDAGTAMLPSGAMQYSIFIKHNEGENTILLTGQAIIIPTV